MHASRAHRIKYARSRGMGIEMFISKEYYGYILHQPVCVIAAEKIAFYLRMKNIGPTGLPSRRPMNPYAPFKTTRSFDSTPAKCHISESWSANCFLHKIRMILFISLPF